MQVAILYNAIADGAALEDQDLLVQVDAVAAALQRLGHKPTPLACTLDLAAMKADLARLRPEVVFNLVESLAEADSLVYLPHAVLDAFDIPYAGNRTEALFLTTHKILAKRWLQQAGLPTAPWVELTATGNRIVAGVEPNNSQAGPASWIVKGVWDQASRGMDDDAVVHGADAAAIGERLQERFGQTRRPCFAEQFIDGREFNLSVLTGPGGPMVLPPAEIDFSAFPPDKPRIVGHLAKWQTDSFEYNNTPRRFDFSAAEQPLRAELQALARRCWELFGLRGWARVDFRVDRLGRPWILEINANPCLSPDAGFAAALEQAGIPFDEAIGRILADTA